MDKKSHQKSLKHIETSKVGGCWKKRCHVFCKSYHVVLQLTNSIVIAALVLEMEGIFKFIRPWQPSCLAKAANLRCLAWQQPKSHQRRKVKRTNPVMLNYSNPINQSFIVILIYHGSSWFISHEFVHQNELHFCLTPWYLALRPPRRVGFRRLSGLVTWSLGSCMVVSCCLPCHPPSTKHVGKQQWSSSQFPRIPTKESLNFFVSFQQPACGQIQLCIWGAYF